MDFLQKLKENAFKLWFVVIQLMTIPANWLLTRFFHLVIEKPENLVITHGTLIIANHQSRIDPFLISYHCNLLTTSPIRYPVTSDYMERPFLGFYIRLLGGYDVGRSPFERLKKLVFTRDILKRGYSVILFPEGKITRDQDMVNDFKKGANMLFQENYPVVFVRLTGLGGKRKFHFWKNTNAKLTYSTRYDSSIPKGEKVQAMAEFFGMNTAVHSESNS